jgi:hypothetical protein
VNFVLIHAKKAKSIAGTSGLSCLLGQRHPEHDPAGQIPASDFTVRLGFQFRIASCCAAGVSETPKLTIDII